jgi:hypothetical protein
MRILHQRDWARWVHWKTPSETMGRTNEKHEQPSSIASLSNEQLIKEKGLLRILEMSVNGFVSNRLKNSPPDLNAILLQTNKEYREQKLSKKYARESKDYLRRLKLAFSELLKA